MNFASLERRRFALIHIIYLPVVTVGQMFVRGRRKRSVDVIPHVLTSRPLVCSE